MTPTEKKYSKYVGNMYWALDRRWSTDEGEYINTYDMIMITGIQRKYSEAGNYVFKIDVLKYANEDEDPRHRNFNFKCAQFIDVLDNPTVWTKFIPVTDGNLPDDNGKIST
jgi:hypothetical protein